MIDFSISSVVRWGGWKRGGLDVVKNVSRWRDDKASPWMLLMWGGPVAILSPPSVVLMGQSHCHLLPILPVTPPMDAAALRCPFIHHARIVFHLSLEVMRCASTIAWAARGNPGLHPLRMMTSRTNAKKLGAGTATNIYPNIWFLKDNAK